MKGKALRPPFLQTMTHTHSLKLCDASWDMGHSISPGFVAKKHVPSKRPKSGFARTKAILMILMLIVQSNRSGRSYFGCLRNPYGGEGTSVHILSTKLILYTFNTRSRLNYFKYMKS